MFHVKQYLINLFYDNKMKFRTKKFPAKELAGIKFYSPQYLIKVFLTAPLPAISSLNISVTLSARPTS